LNAHFDKCSDPARCWCEVRRYAKAVLIGIVVGSLGIFGSYKSGSLSLVSEALHVFIDSAAAFTAMVAAIFALRLTQKAAFRFRVFANYLNAALLAVAAVSIFIEAIHRFAKPETIATPWMLGIAGISIVGNFWRRRMVPQDDDPHREMTGANLRTEIDTDIWQGFAALGAGGLIFAKQNPIWIWDPAASVVVALFMAWSAVRLALSAYRRSP